MWVSFALIFIFVQISLFVKSFWKNLTRKKLECEGLDKKEIPELGWFGILVEILKAATINASTPNYEASANLAKKLGPLSIVRFSDVIPFHPRVLVNSSDLDTCKQVMSSPKWRDRFPESHYLNTCAFNKPFGLFNGGGQYYKVARAQSMKLLHEFGFFSPSRMEGLVSFEMVEVESILAKQINAAGGELTFTPHQMFQVSSLNMVWQMILGQRFSHQDPFVYKMIDCVNETNRNFYAPYTILEVIPFLKHFPWLTSLGAWQGCCDFLHATFKEIIAEKRKEPVEERLKRPPTDLVDGFLQQVDKSGGNDEYLNDQNLMVILRDMVFAGSDTTNSALEFALLYVSLNPDVQRNVQEEIDAVIGTNRAPVYSDKSRMNYTHAVLLETFRLGSSVPGIVRSAMEDTEIHGTKVSKETYFVINMYAIHRSEDIWEDPLVFRPQRFLDEKEKLVNQDKIIPFGFGKRSCMGETVGLVTVFIFFVTLLQKFEFQISPDHPAPSFKNLHGLSRGPLPYYLRVRKRAL